MELSLLCKFQTFLNYYKLYTKNQITVLGNVFSMDVLEFNFLESFSIIITYFYIFYVFWYFSTSGGIPFLFL